MADVSDSDLSRQRMNEGDPYKSLEYWQGRKEEIAQIRQWLQDTNVHLMGIEGMGGVGKSTLATKIFCEEVKGWKRYWVDVSAGDNFADFARGILTKFGAYIPEEKELVRALIGCLQREHCFLVVDNLESLLRESDRQWNSLFYGDFFGQWIECGENSKILVTTRERPDLRGFRAWISLKGLKVEEGVQLLQDLGIRGDLTAFSQLVDGYPLILRLVADFLRDEFPEDPNLERFPALGELRELLRNPQIKGQHRRQKRAIQFVFDESFNRLSEIQQELLLNTSVYRGEFDAEMARTILGDSEEDNEKIEAELKNLVKRSLLEARLREKYCFEFQPVILEYIRNKAGEQIEIRHKVIQYYYSWLQSTKTPEGLIELEDLIKGYQEIVYHFYQLEEYDTAFDTIRQINEFLTLRGLTTVRIELYKPLARVWQQENAKENWRYGASLTDLGNAYQSLGEYQKAIDYHQQFLTIAREIGDRSGEGKSLGNLGIAYYSLGEYQKAIDYHQQSLTIKREIGDRSGEGNSLGNLGIAYQSLGEYQKAIDYQQQFLTIAREIGDRSGEGNSLGNLGNAYQSLGEYQKAIDYHQQFLTIAREIGDRSGEGKSLGNLGNAYRSLGEYQKAIDYQQQFLTIAREIGDRSGEGNSLGNLGNAYRSLGEYQKAIDYQQQFLTIAREIGDRSGEGISLGNLGIAYGSLGEYQKAIDYQQQSLTIAREIGDRSGEGKSLGNLGIAYYSLGEYQKAIDYHQQSLTIKREIGDRSGEGNSLGNLGIAYQSLGEYQKAIDYQQQFLTIAREIGDRSGEGNSLGNLGIAYQSLGEYQKAIDYQQQFLTIAREIGDRSGEGNSLGNLGNAYQSLGEYQKAIDYQQQFLTIAREIGDRSGEGISLGNLGNAYAALKQPLKAIEHHERSLIIKREIGNKREEMHSLQSLCILYQQVGRIQEGITASNQAVAIAQELNLPLEVQPYPNCMKSVIRFAQRSKLHLILCFMLGFVAFPAILILVILAYLILLIRAPFYRK